MYAAIVPHVKKGLKETDLLTFPWEEQLLIDFTIEEEQKLQEEVEKIRNFYESWDNKKAQA